MNWIIPALLSPFFWSFGNIMDKVLTTKYLRMVDYYILGGFFGVAGLLFLPLTNLRILSLKIILIVVVVSFLRYCAYWFYIKAIMVEEASRMIPLFNLGNIFVLMLAVIFLGEILSFSQYFAFFLIMVGASILSIKKTKGLFKVSKAFWYIIINSLFWAVSSIMLKYAFDSVTIWDVTVILSLSSMVMACLMMLNKNLRKNLVKAVKGYKRKVWLTIIAANMVGFAGGIMYNLGVSLGPVSLVTVLAGFQGVFVLMWATTITKYLPRFLREDIDKKTILNKLIAIGIMIVGLYFLYM